MNATKIVVIDDETNIRETLTDILTFQGYKVYAASNGKLGLQCIYREKPDLVLCDIMMPDMDGYEVLTRIRGDETLKGLPFLFISAKNDQDSIRTGMNLGSDDYLSKPFKTADLTAAIETKLRRFKEFKDSLNKEIELLQEQFSQFGFQEFNKPSNSILGVIDFLREYDSQLQNKDRLLFFDRIEQSTHQFKRSYSNLILYLNILSGQPIYQKQKNCSTQESVSNTLKRLKISYPNTHPHLDIEMARLPLNCQAFEFILYELVDNGIKYGENQTAPIVEGKIDNESFVYILKITDFGPGLSAEAIKKVLNTSQLDKKLPDQDGWGLGLFISRYLINQAKATFSFNSVLGQGSTIEVRFPLQ